MKKLFTAAVFLPVCLAVFGQSGLPQLAVVQFSTNDNELKTLRDAVTVRNLVESQLIAAGKYRVITREEIDKLLANQQIVVSSISSSENVKKLQLQNISYIVTGSVDAMGSDYAVTVKVLDVETGQFSHSTHDFMGGSSRELYTGINTLVTAFVAGMAAGKEGTIVQQPQQAVRPAAGKIYKIGDTGPAGGIVFFDKGFSSDGWRYLEAAPQDMGVGLQWGAYMQTVGGTNDGIGSGKRNTELIVSRLKQLGESGRAAQFCDAAAYGGYDDWFLPSKVELNLMYRNLTAKGLGGFSNFWYWSSSEYDNSSACGQSFSDGSPYTDYVHKYNTRSVRAVRAF
ncbi:MAG: DUF1566 domain-containing protein [Treponema sp.]|jgi:hypothetical protein|nr:DUF1566 domain-containing protein [Treponema sp.]